MRKAITCVLVIICAAATISSAMMESDDMNTLPIEDTNPPLIRFIPPTPQNGSHTVPPNFFEVALNSSDENEHYAFVDFDRDLQVWLEMEYTDSSGEQDVILDSSSYGHDAIAYDNAAQQLNGRFGKGFSFNGDGDYLLIDKQLIFDKTFTFGAWIKWDTIAQNPWPEDCPIMHVDSDENGWALCVRGDWGNKLFAYYAHDSEGALTTPYPVVEDTWYHVLIVHSDTDMSLYVNGAFIDSCNPGYTIDTQYQLLIGGMPHSGGYYWFDGTLDEIVLFNRTLSESEIQSLYNANAYQYHNTFSDLRAGNYSFTGYAVDSYGNKNHTETRWQELLNDSPDTPPQPVGSETGTIAVEQSYSTSSVDPNDHQIRYGWDWDDGSPVEWSDFYDSGVTAIMNHTFSETGSYEIRVIAEDFYSEPSEWSATLTVNITNDAPVQPITPEGPTAGTIKEEYTFETVTTDPDDHQLRYGWDIDDDFNVDTWTSLVDSGTSTSISLTWNTVGIYTIRVIAEDEYGAQSMWSDPLQVNISSPILKIEDIQGGLFKLSTSINNIGGADASEVIWKIRVVGNLIITGESTEDTIDVIASQEQVQISSNAILGFGRAQADITTYIPSLDLLTSKEQDILILLFFIIPL